MFSVWSKKKAEDPSALIRQELESDESIMQALREVENSSRQRPGLSKIHNLGLKHSATVNLISLPPKLRKEIYRLAIVREDGDVPVSAHNKSTSAEPALLSVCKEIRQEARPVFYIENGFSVHIIQFDMKAALPWIKKCKVIREVEDDRNLATISGMICEQMGTAIADMFGGGALVLLRGADQKKESSSSKDTINPKGMTKAAIVQYQNEYHTTQLYEEQHAKGRMHWTVDLEQPNWENLVEWLHLFHAGKIEAFTDSFGPTSWEMRVAVAGAFDVVENMKHCEWEDVLKALPGLRTMLSAVDVLWLE